MGFVYKWTNKQNGKWYIGSHNGSLTDGYTASGKVVQDAFAKYGISSFIREILYEGPLYREKEETLLIQLDAANNPMSYNLKNKAVGGDVWIGRKHTIEYENYKKKIGSPGETNPMFGKTHTEEAKRKISQANTGNIPWNKNKVGYMTEEHKESFSRTGWKHSSTTKQKMSAKRAGSGNANAKKVSINGVTYNTIAEASQATGLSAYKINQQYKTFRD